MKKVLFLTLLGIIPYVYTQEITITTTSIHYKVDGYFKLKEGPSGNFYRLVNGELKEGYAEKTKFNSLNLGVVVNYKNWLIGGYQNSYHRFSFLLGRNIPIYRDKIELNVGAATGYKTNHINNRSKQFTNPGTFTPMYSLNVNVGPVKVMLNHFFVGFGFRVGV